MDEPMTIQFQPVFPGAKVGLMKCLVDGCPWEFVGPRASFTAAWGQHRREQHMEDVAVVITHHGDTRLDDLIAMQKPRESIILAR